MSYAFPQPLSFDISSRHTSRAASPNPQGPPLASTLPPPPRYPAPAPSAASFGPSYYQRPAATDLGQINSRMGAAPPTARPQSAYPTTAPVPMAQANYTTGAPAVPFQSYTAAPSYTAKPHQPSGSDASRHTLPTMTTTSFGPRGMNQPPRNSMEMVNDAIDQWKQKLDTEQQQLMALEEEEKQLDLEEQTLRRKMMDLSSQNRVIDQIMMTTQRGWSTLYEQEHELRLKESDPAQNEENVLLEKIAVAEQQLFAARMHHQQLEQHSAAVQAELQSLGHVEQTRREQESTMEALITSFERLESRRQKAKLTCDKYYEIETRRESAARAHLQAIQREALEDGEVGPSAPVSRANSVQMVRSDPAPQRVETEEEADGADDDFEPGLAMDSVLLSVCNNTKKRRMEASQPLSRHPSAPALRAF